MLNDEFAAARAEAVARFEQGWRPQKLFGAENLKLLKAASMGWRGLGLSMAPADISGHEMCASRSEECTRFCIFTSGRGLMHSVMMGRIFRSIWFFRDRRGFVDRMLSEIDRNRDAAIRLNVFSDIMWERMFPEIFSAFPEVQFYDYTKHAKRMFRDRPANYHLTFSLTEDNEDQAREVLNAGMNVAAVVTHKSGKLLGRDIIDGDEHDLRFLDPKPCVVGLTPKGRLGRSAAKGMIYEPARFHEAA